MPDRTVSSEHLERTLGLKSGWIAQRTGIGQRRWVAEGQAVSDLAVSAGQRALDRCDRATRERVQTLILATSTPDHPLPPTAPLVADHLGMNGIAAFDLAAACPGFLYALRLADAICRADGSGVLVIAANVLSRRIRQGDPATTALFADGAGAVVVMPGGRGAQILGVRLSSDGSGWDQLIIPHGGSRHPVDATSLKEGLHRMQIRDGMSVFRYAVESMSGLGEAILEEHQLTSDDVDWWVPHQANRRIIDAAGKRLGVPPERTMVTVDSLGNSSAATIPIALDRLSDTAPFTPGQIVLLTAAGAGLASGAALLRQTS